MWPPSHTHVHTIDRFSKLFNDHFQGCSSKCKLPNLCSDWVPKQMSPMLSTIRKIWNIYIFCLLLVSILWWWWWWWVTFKPSSKWCCIIGPKWHTTASLKTWIFGGFMRVSLLKDLFFHHNLVLRFDMIFLTCLWIYFFFCLIMFTCSLVLCDRLCLCCCPQSPPSVIYAHILALETDIFLSANINFFLFKYLSTWCYSWKLTVIAANCRCCSFWLWWCCHNNPVKLLQQHAKQLQMQILVTS
jgi:hypothetical protein